MAAPPAGGPPRCPGVPAGPGILFIDDTRGGGAPATHSFADPVARIYVECCETMRRPCDVVSRLGCYGGRPAMAEPDVQVILDEFSRLGLMVRDDGWYLGLAVPANPNW